MVKQSLAGPPVDDIQYAVPAGRSQPVAVSHARRPKASSSMLASGMNGDSPQVRVCVSLSNQCYSPSAYSVRYPAGFETCPNSQSL